MKKYKLRVPTETYGFVEAEVESAKEAKAIRDEVTEAFGQYDFYYGGLNQNEFARLRNTYMATGVMNPDSQDLLQKCNRDQRTVMNHIKLGLKQDELKDINK